MKKILLIALLSTSYSFSQCFVQIASGEQHTVAIADDGTLWGWGSNTSGECGITPNQHVLSPTQIGSATDWIDVDCGPYHTIALRSNGEVYTMGYNNNGQCGTGNQAVVLTPTMVASNVANVAAGKGYSSYLIKNDSTLWACGMNNGRFGNGTTTSSSSFIQVSTATNWLDIAGGLNHSIAINSSNEVWTSGNNSDGQLGLYNLTNMNTRTQVNITTFTPMAIDAGSNFSIILDDLGQPFTCGSNANGRLGLGNTSLFFQMYFYPLNLSGISKIKAGYNGAIAMNDTSLYTWGTNPYMITSGIAGDQYAPVLRTFITSPIDASMGTNNIAIINDAEGVYNWGQNDRGNCGSGNTTNLSAPVLNVANCSNCTGTFADIYPEICPGTVYTAPDGQLYSQAGNYVATLINAAGCDSTINISLSLSTVNLNDAITANAGTITATETNATYQWLDCSSFQNVIGETSQTFTPTVSGSYAVLLFDQQGCSVTSNCEFVGVNAIDESILTSVIAYPNPATDELNISLTVPSSIVITDINGKQLLTSASNTMHQVNVSYLQSGIYFIRTENGATHKFSKH